MVDFGYRDTSQQHSDKDTPQSPLQRQEFSELEVLRMALNQVDYGLVVVEAETGTVQFANALGRDALEHRPDSRGTRSGDHGLRLANGRVVTCRAGDADLLTGMLARTRAGLRGLLSLGNGGQAAAVAVMPLAPRFDNQHPEHSAAAPSLALLVFAKLQPCDDSTMALFARERGLTSAEGQVLTQICRGLRPAQIADQHGVRISTVRTQLRSIRMKTCCDTIRDLVQKVSVLPPMALHLSARSAALA